MHLYLGWLGRLSHSWWGYSRLFYGPGTLISKGTPAGAMCCSEAGPPRVTFRSGRNHTGAWMKAAFVFVNYELTGTVLGRLTAMWGWERLGTCASSEI